MKKVLNKNQSGRSMVEMLGVLAIIGVLSVGGIAGYSAAMEKYRINKTLEYMQLVIQNVRTLFENEDSFSGMEYANTDGEGADEVSGKILKSVAADAPYRIFLSGDEDVFRVGVSGINKSVCIMIGSQNWSSYGDNYDETSVNVNAVAQMSVSKAESSCKDSDLNFVSLSFNKNGSLIETFIAQNDG